MDAAVDAVRRIKEGGRQVRDHERRVLHIFADDRFFLPHEGTAGGGGPRRQ